MNLQHLMSLFTILLFLASCGGGKSSMKLEVTHNFATGNSSFDGGLYIQGLNRASGEEFVFFLQNQTSTSVDLKFGIWEIRVIGWDNDPDLLEGDTLCARQTIDFKSEQQTVNIRTTKDKCKDSVFASSSMVGANGFIPLEIATCGALYSLSDSKELRTRVSPSFCNQYPIAFRNKAKFMTVSLHTKPLGSSLVEGPGTACLSASGPNANFPKVKSLPTKIPVTINFYDDPNCQILTNKYFFPRGLEHNLSREELGFDAVLDSTSKVLALASPLSQRGTTPFTHILPNVTCGTTSQTQCLNLPPLPTGTNGNNTTTFHYVLSRGYNTIKMSGDACNYIHTFSSSQINVAAGATPITNPIALIQCHPDGTDSFLNLEVNFTVMDGTQLSFSINGSTFNVLIRSQEVMAYRELKRYLGFNPSPSGEFEKSIVDHDDEDETGYLARLGILGNIHDILSPSKLGGIFWDHNCDDPLNYQMNRSVSFLEDGKYKSYMISLGPSPSTLDIPKFIKQTNSKFDRRIRVIDPTGTQMIMTMDLTCGSPLNGSMYEKVGRLEEYNFNSFNFINRTERKLTFWNTTIINEARYETFYLTEEDGPANPPPGTTPLRRNSGYVRVEKTSAGKSKITQMNYNYNLKNQNSYESLRSSQYDISNNIFTVTNSSDLLLENHALGEIFNDEAFRGEKYKIRLKEGSISDSVKISSNGYSLSASFENNTKRLFLNYFGSVIVPDTETLTNTPSIVASDISEYGTYGIVATVTNNYGIQIWYFNSNSWTPIPSTVTLNNTVSDIKVAILENGLFIIVAKTGSGLVYDFGDADVQQAPSQLIHSLPCNQNCKIKLLKDDTHFWIFESSPGVLNAYRLNNSNNNVTPAYNIINSVNYSLQDFSVYSERINNVLGIYLTVFECQSGVNPLCQYKNIQFPDAENPYLPTISSWPFSLSTNPFQLNTKTVDMGNLNPTTAPIPVNVTIPYSPPSDDDFKINYMSLNPTTLKAQVFTNFFPPSGNAAQTTTHKNP